MPRFGDFTAEMIELCASPGQSGPLEQRFALLESVVAESERNQKNGLAQQYAALRDIVAPGTVVMADLTDPLMSAADVNGLFRVLLEQFRACDVTAGKLVVLDEAHRYLSEKSGFAAAVVDAARPRVDRSPSTRVEEDPFRCASCATRRSAWWSLPSRP